MKKVVLIFFWVACFGAPVYAQMAGGTFLVDMTMLDRSVNEKAKYEGINGEPFLLKNFATGSVVVKEKGTAKNISLNYDEVAEQVLMEKDGKVMVITMPIDAFTVTDAKIGGTRIFKSGFKPTSFTTEKSFFEVLADGDLVFLKKNIKTVVENKEYSGATAKSVKEDLRYYVSKGDQVLIPIKLDQKSILDVLADKKKELTDYADSEKLGFKKAQDVAKIVAHYNAN